MLGKRIKEITIILLFTLGLIIFMYPIVINMINTNSNNERIQEYDKVAKESSEDSDKEKELAELFEEMENYNKKIYSEGQKGILDPFAYEVPAINLEEFGMNEEMIGHIDIPSMNIKLPIYLGASNSNMAKGATQLNYTSIPIGGANTNVVIAAHRGMRTQAMFRDIENVELGDEITITNYWETLKYRVVDIKIISPSDVSRILIQEGKDMVTLITCHPYTKNSQRYAVYAERLIEDTSKENIKEPEIIATSKPISDDNFLIKFEKIIRIIGIVILVVGLVSYIVRIIKRN